MSETKDAIMHDIINCNLHFDGNQLNVIKEILDDRLTLAPWTTEPPSEEGWYWWTDGENICMAEIFGDIDDDLSVQFYGHWMPDIAIRKIIEIKGLWQKVQGPLKPEPEDTTWTPKDAGWACPACNRSFKKCIHPDRECHHRTTFTICHYMADTCVSDEPEV